MTEAPNKGRRDKNDALWLYRQKPIIALHLLGALLALGAPNDVLSRNPVLREFVAGLNAVFPIVSSFAGRSVFPELLQLYAAVMLTTTPIWFLVYIRWPGREDRIQHMLTVVRESKWRLALMHLFGFMMPIALYMCLFVENRFSDLSIAPFQSSRIALALVGPVVFCWLPAFGIAGLIMVFEAIRRYWKGETR